MPQNMNLNRGQWREMERQWGIAASEGKTVEIEITPVYTGDSVRPDRFEVVYRIDGGDPIPKEFVNRPGG